MLQMRRVQEWEAIMGGFQQPLHSPDQASDGSSMERVFSLADQ